MFTKLKKAEIFEDGKFAQVLLLSGCFMLIFTAFMTTCIIEQTVIDSVKQEDSSFAGDGYISLAIVYAVFAVVAWIAPSIVAVLHAKKALFFSSIFYLLFIVGFLYPTAWILYLTSATIGAGAAVLWTAQGNFLSLTSSPTTISRNSGVFWGINQCSLFFGNIFVYWQFLGKKHIDSETRLIVFGVLSAVCFIGVLCFLLLKDLRNDPKETKDDDNESVGKRSNRRNPSGFVAAWNAMKEAFALAGTPHMLLLSVASLYTGLEQSFYGGVYSTSVGFTNAFGSDVKRLVGLSGILIGVGEVVGGGLFGLLGPVTTKKGQTPIIILGLATHVACYGLVYLNLPNDAPHGATDAVSYFKEPLVPLALLCAFFLGFGDACFQTQLISMFASGYKEKSAAAFAIFKFIQSAASAGAFFINPYMGLYVQLLILVIFCLLASICFAFVEWRIKKKALLKSKSAGIEDADQSGDVPLKGDTSLAVVEDNRIKEIDE